jgi:hypothetical protein|nr:MAG TPA: hypothetical protein [Caudoviricetes sp.]
MRAEKGNKVYTITEEEKERYQNDGFDIFSDDGEIIVYGIGKNIPYEEYAALKKENEALKKENEALKEKLAQTETSQASEKPEEPKTKSAKK